MLQPRDLKGRAAISYARWSSGKQALGDSLRRQTENAENFCATYGLTLDRQLIDDGVSAFKGDNLEASFGRFVQDVRSGNISSDVVLIVENIDRVTRVNHMEALEYFTGLLRTGITFVTLTDGRVHTYEDYKQNLGSLMLSVMSMYAAHDYSDKISKRVKASWDSRVKRAKNGPVRISKVPFWIDQQTQQLNERADVALLIFQLAEEGHGHWAIVKTLNERGIPSAAGGKWEKSGVQYTLASKAAYGSYVVKGEEVREYFPAIISEARWLTLRSRTRERSRNPQASNTANLFPRLIRCHHCGYAMNVSSTRMRGKTFRYLSCMGKALKRSDCTAPNWRYDTFEAAFIDRLGLLLAIPVEGEASTEDAQVAELGDRIVVLASKLDNLTAAVAEAETAGIRKALVTQADKVGREIEVKQLELVKLRESAARFAAAENTLVDLEAHLEEIRRFAREDRPTAQRLIGDLVEQITLETSSETLKRAQVTLRGGWRHNIVFDTSGEP